MPATKTFSYEAVDSAGAVRKGSIDSESAEGRCRRPRRSEAHPADGAGRRGPAHRHQDPGLRQKRTSLKDLAILSRQFASMTSSGLTLTRSLAILEEQTEKPKSEGRDRSGPIGRPGRHGAVQGDVAHPEPVPAVDGQHDRRR